jgi:hypothetical protein
MPSSSGSSEEMTRHRLALGGEPVDDRVDLVLGADVDAAGRLVEDQHVRVGEDPLAEDDLLLVAAGQLAGDRLEDVGALMFMLAEPLGDLPYSSCSSTQPRLASLPRAAAEMLRLMSSMRLRP